MTDNDKTFLGIKLDKLTVVNPELPWNDLIVAGKNIKYILKTLYPDIPIKIKTNKYSQGNSLNVMWPDYKSLGLQEREVPDEKIIQEIEKTFSAGKYDGYQDSYEVIRNDMHMYGRAKFIFCESSSSVFSAEKIIEDEKKILEKNLKKMNKVVKYNKSNRI